MIPPGYEATVRQLDPQGRLIKLNSDGELAVASRLGIQGIPTMFSFKKVERLHARPARCLPPRLCDGGATACRRWLSEPAEGPAIGAAGDCR